MQLIKLLEANYFLRTSVSTLHFLRMACQLNWAGRYNQERKNDRGEVKDSLSG